MRVDDISILGWRAVARMRSRRRAPVLAPAE